MSIPLHLFVFPFYRVWLFFSFFSQLQRDWKFFILERWPFICPQICMYTVCKTIQMTIWLKIKSTSKAVKGFSISTGWYAYSWVIVAYGRFKTISNTYFINQTWKRLSHFHFKRDLDIWNYFNDNLFQHSREASNGFNRLLNKKKKSGPFRSEIIRTSWFFYFILFYEF